jgi:hypothetical protein
MARLDSHLQRLLNLAATAKEEDIGDGAPFGFDTKVLANWRAVRKNENGELMRFVRRVALVAIAITVLGGAAAYRQLDESDDLNEPLTNDYAMADSVIESQLLQ